MMHRRVFTFALSLALPFVLASSVPSDAWAAEEKKEIPEQVWSFSGPFGTFDRATLQRGLQVYREVCSSCHSLDLIAFRNLSALGYSDEEIKAFAAEYSVTDGPNEQGEMFERDAVPSDRFPSPFPNPEAASAALGAAPPDLSLMAKARFGGPDYIHALLTGYEEAPEDMQLEPGIYYNPYKAGGQIAMAPPLTDGLVDYADGTEATVEQMSRDVSAFLMWTAEPTLEARKQMGIKVLFFLIIFTAVLYATKRRVWSRLKQSET